MQSEKHEDQNTLPDGANDADTPMYVLLLAEKLLTMGPLRKNARQEFKVILLKADESESDVIKDAARFLLYTKFEGAFDVDHEVAKRFRPESETFKDQQELYNEAQKRIDSEYPTRFSKALRALRFVLRQTEEQIQFNMLLLHVASSMLATVPNPRQGFVAPLANETLGAISNNCFSAGPLTPRTRTN